MPTSQMSEVIQHLRRTVLLRDGAGLTDGQLLEDYINRREEAAVAALVWRHGPMVWGVCRRILGNHHDAEDAFQATFLVLVRKATSIVPREMVANWLYGVARQTALKARATAARKKERERQVTEMPEPAVAEQDLWHDLQPLLDEELSHLPDRYRAVIILCDLEGKTRKEAARQLGCPEGTVAGRLARARVMLAKRLAKRGVVLSAGSLAAVVSQNVASAGVPTSLMSFTVEAAAMIAAGQATVAGVVPAKVAALTEGVLKTMLFTKLKLVLVVLVVAVLSGGAGLLYRTQAAAQPRADSSTGTAHPKQELAARSDEKPALDGGTKKLQGTWTLVAVTKSGQTWQGSEVAGIIVFEGNTFKTNLEMGVGTYKLTASTKPRGIDFQAKTGKKFACIYDLDGDDLRIAYTPDPADARLHSFESTADNNTVVAKFTHDKDSTMFPKGRFHDFGEVASEGAHVATFTIRNTTKMPLKILSVRQQRRQLTGTADADKILRPGEETKVQAVLNTTGLKGPMNGWLYVSTESIPAEGDPVRNDPITLFVSANPTQKQK